MKLVYRFFDWYIPIYEKHHKRSFHGDMATLFSLTVFAGLIWIGCAIHDWLK